MQCFRKRQFGQDCLFLLPEIAPFLQNESANFLRFAVCFINFKRLLIFYTKLLDRSHTACYHEHMNRCSYIEAKG